MHFKPSAGLALAALTLAATVPFPALAGPALTPVGGTDILNKQHGYSGGYEFTTNSAVTVTALGFYTSVAGQANFVDDHPLALYTSTGTLLASSDVNSTNFSFVDGRFVYSIITPITLTAGGDYVVTGAAGLTDAYLFNSVDTMDPSIDFIENRFNLDTYGNQFADQTGGGAANETGYFGGSFYIAPPAVPEASTMVSFSLLLAFGLGCVVIAAKRTKAVAS